jgi:hypothetical protein
MDMRKTFVFALLVTIGSMGAFVTASADDDCGAGLEGNWNIKHADDIKKHLKDHLKIEKSGKGKYAVKIKNESGDILFESTKDFSLTCNGSKGELSGEVKMGHCVHKLEIGYMGKDEISIKIPTVHEKGDCSGHKDALHEEDRKHHIKVATGVRRGSGKD